MAYNNPKPKSSIELLLSKFFVQSQPLTITQSGGSQTQQLYFETNFLCRQIRVDVRPQARVPQSTNLASTNSFTNGITLPVEEIYNLSLQSEQGDAYIPTTNPIYINQLNGMDKLWWMIPNTKLNIQIAHDPHVSAQVDTFPVDFKVSFIGYKLNFEYSPEELIQIIEILN